MARSRRSAISRRRPLRASWRPLCKTPKPRLTLTSTPRSCYSRCSSFVVCTTLSVSRYNNHQMLTLDNLTQAGVSPEDFLPTQDLEDNLKGMRELYRNPHYLYLLARLAVEERQATEEVFRGGVNETVEQHFKHIGLVLGLVRIKDLH